MKILVTGAAGFIGFHVCQRLLARGDEVVGLDNLNDYYSPILKEARMQKLLSHSNFHFFKIDLAQREEVESLFNREHFRRVIHLAAQAGVRYSLTNPHIYLTSNITGFLHILEGCRHHQIDHLVYASSSSVYGLNARLPFSVQDNVDHPISLYAATKKSNELMAHSYSHLYQLPTTGLRFFTVYGPWGRPDMAPFKFVRAILEKKPIDVYNQGHMQRDFTYIDDIVEGVVRSCDQVAASNTKWNPHQPDPSSSTGPYRLYNIGNNQPVALLDFIKAFEKALGQKATLNLLPLQPGDVLATAADVEALSQAVGFRPNTPLEVGVQRFVDWYLAHRELVES